MSLPITFISGPTAIGKSRLAYSLALKNKCEIINADSMQVYKELKILTDRPSKNEQKEIMHHLYGHVSGKIRYNVADWCKETMSILKKNINNNTNSIIVGGTGLYFKTLLNGIAEIPFIPEKYKESSNKLLLNIGVNKFYKEVYKIDKIACEKIKQNDTQRLKRIWEVYNATGKKLSEWIVAKHNTFLKNCHYRFYLFLPERNEMYNNVNIRFSKMIENGAIEEVKKLLSLNLHPSLPIMKAHGVREISDYLSGLINLDQCIAKGQQITRNYVKRQITWWRSAKIKNCTIFEKFPSNIDLNSFNLSKN